MAKAGFWLRGAKGKLAGASMQKGAKGQTIMREIVTPRNPKTNAQLYQRAIMATAMKLYAGMSMICDHSFQGVSVGAATQREFIRINVRRLRGELATALANTSEYVGFVAPQTSSFVPAGNIIISRGDYNLPESWGGGLNFDWTNKANQAKFYKDNVLVPGDIITLVAVNQTSTDPIFTVRGYGDDVTGVSQYPCKMVFARLQVRPILEDGWPASPKISDVFTVTENTGLTITTLLALDSDHGAGHVDFEGVSSLLLESNANMKALGIIRSRLDEDLRSTTTLSIIYPDEDFQSPAIMAEHVLEAWKQGTEPVGDSDLILEGGNG